MTSQQLVLPYSSSTAQTQVTARLMQAMKKNAEVEDLRSKFY